jgi:phospholipase/carboxylesterase
VSGLTFPARRQPPAGLVLMLHGVGAAPESMASLARSVADALPDVDVRVPPAPDPFEGGRGRQWFSINGIDEQNRSERIAAALPTLERLVASELAACGLGRDRLALVGFSQGAMMTLAMAASSRPPATAVGIAGRLAVDRLVGGARQPDLLLLHGAQDPVVPAGCAVEAADRFRAAGYRVRLSVQPALAHAISPAQAQAVVRHLSATFAQRREAQAA